eukprot:7669000-Alexandrium_andersonii.AAC.1
MCIRDSSEGVGCLDIDAQGRWRFMSGHLPHNWGPNAPTRDRREEQWDLLLDKIETWWKPKRTLVGVDANARTGSLNLAGAVGGSGP